MTIAMIESKKIYSKETIKILINHAEEISNFLLCRKIYSNPIVSIRNMILKLLKKAGGGSSLSRIHNKIISNLKECKERIEKEIQYPITPRKDKEENRNELIQEEQKRIDKVIKHLQKIAEKKEKSS